MLTRRQKHPLDCQPTLFAARYLARKQALRAQVDQLSVAQQRQFVLAATLLIIGRAGNLNSLYQNQGASEENSPLS